MYKQKEEWKTINGFENYMVSNLGRIKNSKTGRINNGGLCNGYLRVGLCREKKTYYFLVHRIVASTYIDNPYNKPIVDHINTDKLDNRVENLRWVTSSENSHNPITYKKSIRSSSIGHDKMFDTTKMLCELKPGSSVVFNIAGKDRQITKQAIYRTKTRYKLNLRISEIDDGLRVLITAL